ncbi:MAG: ABC transporter permease [Anaerolineae bacterium]|nr:ABC transporter permease [Anaerolineae bacterium]
MLKSVQRLTMLIFARRESAALALLLAIGTLLGLQSETFLTPNNLLNVVRSFSWIAIAAFGESLVIIIGGIDLSVGAVMGLAGLIGARCMQSGMPLLPAIVAGLLTGCLVGWINGTIVGRVRLPPFMVTLGTMSIVRGIAFGLTGGWPIRDLPMAFRLLGRDMELYSVAVPVPVLVMAFLAVVMSLLLTHTVQGTYIYTLGSNERALLVSGVNVAQVKVFVYTLCGLLAAVGGLLMTARLGVAAPTAATGYELDIIAAAVIGGTSLFGGEGSILGVLVGAAVMQVLRNGLVLSGFPAYWQTTVLGTMILLFILLDYWRRRGQV